MTLVAYAPCGCLRSSLEDAAATTQGTFRMWAERRGLRIEEQVAAPWPPPRCADYPRCVPQQVLSELLAAG